MDGCLCFGDYVTLYSDQHGEYGGYVFANHSSSAFNEVAVSNGGKRKKPVDENVLTFEVCPPTRYQLSRYCREQLQKVPEDNSDSPDSNTRNQVAFEAEQSFNVSEIRRQKGQPVCYGQTVQFRHKFTDKFVHGSNVTTSSLEKENGSVTLQVGDSIDGQFRILSKHKFRREGDYVSLNERVVFESISCPAYYLHVSADVFNDDKYAYNKSFQLNLSTARSTFFITRNSSPSSGDETRLKTGDVVRFFHNEMQGYLVAEGRFGREIKENVHLRLRPQTRERPHSLQPSSSAITYWQIELVTPSEVGDGVIKQSSTVRLLHLCTRQYLCLEAASKVALTPDPLEAKAQFKLVSADSGADDVCRKSSYSLQNISTRHWIHVSADFQTYKRLQSAGNTDSRPLESLQISRAKLVTVEGSTAPSVGDYFSERQYEDLFVIEKVDQTDYMHYTFVAGMVPYISKKQIEAVEDTALSRNILKSFEEMISFMKEDRLPVKNRQKLFRNLGIIDRMIEILNKNFQPGNLHMCAVFKLIYDALRMYVRGKSRKNKTHVARHMSLYFSHFSYLEGQVYQHAVDMVNEFIKDNMDVVERITNDDMTKLVDYIRRDKEYRFLQLMDNFCICQSTAVQDNQKYITNSWLKSEAKNCLYFTKMGRDLGRDGTHADKVFVTINNAKDWMELSTLTKEPHLGREYPFFCHMLKTFENLCFGRNKYAIETLTSSLGYINVEQASTCLRNTDLPKELRALYCQLIIAVYVNNEENQATVKHVEELYLYKYNNGNEEAQSHIIRDENSGTENNNEQQGMKDLNKLELTTFVDAYLSMDNIQTSTDVQTNKLTAQVLALLNHLILLEKYEINEKLVSQLVQILNGKTDKPEKGTEDEIHRYRETERFKRSDSTAAIVETKIQCLNIMETIFNHVLKSRLKELLREFKRTKGSSEKPPEIMDPSSQPEERFVSVAKDVVHHVFVKTAKFSNFDLPSILLDLTKYEYENLVTKTMKTLYHYSSGLETLLIHAGKVQVLNEPVSITKCSEAMQTVTVIKEKLSAKMMGADATEVVNMLDGLCFSEDGVPQTSVQNFLVSQGILDCIFNILTSEEHQADALADSVYIDIFMRTKSMDIDSRPLQTSALQLLQRVVDSNDRVQDLAFGKLDILLSMQNKLPEVFQVIKLIFAGNMNTCKQISDSQVRTLVQHLMKHGDRHATILLDILHTIVKPVRFGEPLRRNQNLVMRHITAIKSKIANQFSLDEGSLISFVAEPDRSKVTNFLATIDLMASCAQKGSKTSKLTLKSMIQTDILFKVLDHVSNHVHRMRSFLRFLTYVFIEDFDVNGGGLDDLWQKNEITLLNNFLETIVTNIKRIADREKFPVEDLQKIISQRTHESTTDGSAEESLCYIMEAVVPFCQCLCEHFPVNKMADSTKMKIINICEQFKVFLEMTVPYVDIISLDLRKQLIECLKTMKACVGWTADTLELEQKFDSEDMSTNISDPTSEQEINRQYQTFVRNLMLASEGYQKQSEMPSNLVKKSNKLHVAQIVDLSVLRQKRLSEKEDIEKVNAEKLEFGDLDMKPELKLLYQHLAVFVDKSNGEIFEITGKITQTLDHTKAMKQRHEVVYENPGLHRRYLQTFRMFLLQQIVQLPTDFELYIFKNRRQLERVRHIQKTLINNGAVECALQDFSPHLPNLHLRESLQLLNCLLFNVDQECQDAIFQFLSQRPDVLVIATLQSRIAGFRDFAADMNHDSGLKAETDRKVTARTTPTQDPEVVRPMSGEVSLDLSKQPSTSQEAADNIAMMPITQNESSLRQENHGRGNKVHPFIERDQKKKESDKKPDIMDKVDKETVEITSLVLEFVSNVCQNQHSQLQNYFRVQYPVTLSTDFVNVLAELIDTVNTQINTHTVTVVTQTYDCLAKIISGNADNKVAVLRTRVCEQTNFILFMDLYRDCSALQVYNLKKSVGTFWQAMTEETSVVHTQGSDRAADLASTAIEYLDSEVILQIMTRSTKDQKSKECKRIRGLVRTVGFQFCMLLERKLFIFPSLSKHDILETEEDKDAYKVYSTSIRSVELQKDDALHKVFFRVRDKHAYSDDIKEQIKYEVDRSSPSQKIQDFMKWSSETTDYARHRWHVCRSGVGKLLVYSWLPVNYMMLILSLAILVMIGIDYDGGGNGSKRYDADRGRRVSIAVYALGGVHNFLSLVIFICFITLNSPQFHGLMHLYQVTKSIVKGKPNDRSLKEFELQKKGSRLQVNAYGPRMIYYFLFLTASICGTAFHGYTFALCLLQIVQLNRYLKRIGSVILHNGKYLGMTILLVLIILYMYAIGAFLFFREVYILQSNGHYCNSMPQCFVTILHHGLVGTAYEMFDHATTSSFTDAVRIGLYNVSFFVVITILALYVVLACLVDGFLCLKQKMRHAKEDFRAVCFVCGRPNADFSRAGKAFEEHVKREHNLWDYLYFFIHLDTTPTSEYSALENCVYGQMKEGKYDFLPINRAICLETTDKADRMKLSGKKAGEENEHAVLKKKLRKLPSFNDEPSRPKEKKHGQAQKDEARKKAESKQTLDVKYLERKQSEPFVERQALQPRKKSEAVPTKERRKSEAQGKDITRSRDTVEQVEVSSQKELQVQIEKEPQDIESKVEDLQERELDIKASVEKQGQEDIGAVQQGEEDLGTEQKRAEDIGTEQQGADNQMTEQLNAEDLGTEPQGAEDLGTEQQRIKDMGTEQGFVQEGSEQQGVE